MIPPPAPVPPLLGRDAKATMIKSHIPQVSMTMVAFVTAAYEISPPCRREAQGVG